MNPSTVFFAGLLLASAVTAGSVNSVRSHNPSSSEEYSQLGQNINRPSYYSPPETFDARKYWSQCPSIGSVPDEGCCDASYVLIPTAVMTDRTCIISNNSFTAYSAYDPLTCCPDCAYSQEEKCRGGNPVAVWKYWTKTGILSELCLSYSRMNCSKSLDCPNRCDHDGPDQPTNGKSKGSMYYPVMANVLHIQVEIMLNGPVEASFDMYSDFVSFKGEGVYSHRMGPYLGKHSVKIIGWGTRDGTPYWLIVNTKGRNWGNEGIGKFLRGRNHLNLEVNVRGGKPNF